MRNRSHINVILKGLLGLGAGAHFNRLISCNLFQEPAWVALTLPVLRAFLADPGISLLEVENIQVESRAGASSTESILQLELYVGLEADSTCSGSVWVYNTNTLLQGVHASVACTADSTNVCWSCLRTGIWQGGKCTDEWVAESHQAHIVRQFCPLCWKVNQEQQPAHLFSGNFEVCFAYMVKHWLCFWCFETGFVVGVLFYI